MSPLVIATINLLTFLHAQKAWEYKNLRELARTPRIQSLIYTPTTQLDLVQVQLVRTDMRLSSAIYYIESVELQIKDQEMILVEAVTGFPVESTENPCNNVPAFVDQHVYETKNGFYVVVANKVKKVKGTYTTNDEQHCKVRLKGGAR